MKIVICSKSELALIKAFEPILNFIKQRKPYYQVVSFNAEPDKSNWRDSPNVFNCLDGFSEFCSKMECVSDLGIAQRLAESRLPATLYKGDPRLFYGETSERDLALEQLYLEKRFLEYCDAERPDLVICGAAGRLIWTVPVILANQMGIPGYKMLGLSYLNPNGEGIRYWPTRNIHSELSSDPLDQFQWPLDKLKEHVIAFLEAVKERQYKLEARSFSIRQNFVTTGPKALLWDVAQVILKRDGRALSKLVSMKNRYQNRRLISQEKDLPRPYFVFPLNMPADEQLILRVPHYKDILSACEIIANILPYGHYLVIKEHPVHPGMLDHRRLKAFLDNFKNVRYVSGDTSLHSLLDHATGLITVNSTAAIDALVRDIPVICIGATFYKGTGLTYDIEDPADGPQIMKQAILDPKRATRRQDLIDVLCRLLQESYPGPGIHKAQEPMGQLEYFAEAILAKAKIIESHNG